MPHGAPAMLTFDLAGARNTEFASADARRSSVQTYALKKESSSISIITLAARQSMGTSVPYNHDLFLQGTITNA